MTPSIHQTDAEKAMLNQERGFQGVQSKLDGVQSSVDILRESMTENLDSLAQDVNNPEKVVRKLEEVKSASLVSNQFLKKISQREPTKEVEVSLKGVSILTIKGDKGDSPSSDELVSLIKPLIPEPLRGEKGDSITGPQGPRGDKGESVVGPQGPKGEKGESIIGPKGNDGKDGSPDTPDEVVDKVNKAEKKIEAKQISGLEKALKYVDDVQKNPVGNGGGGAQRLTFQDEGTTITDNPISKLNVVGSGGSITYSGLGVATLTLSGGGGGGTVDSIVAGNNIDVDATDPANPIVSVETLTLADVSDITASVTEVNYTDGVTSAIQTQLNAKAADADVVHDTGDEIIAGVKTFSSDPLIPDEAYGAGWNGSLEPATKNALYDKIETLGGGSGITRSIVVTSGSATMGSTASTDYVYQVAGAHTMSLPAASGNTNLYTVKNKHSANITIDTAGAETIEGAASISIAPDEAVDIYSDGTNWQVK